MKRALDALLILFFLVAPFAIRKKASPWLRYGAPDRYGIVTLIVMLVSRTITHTLEDMRYDVLVDAANSAITERGSLYHNLSEFRELIIYYLFAVYLIDVIILRKPPGDSGEEVQDGD
jgi:hypothetical protein